jgi:hypothetical protein
VYWSLEFSVDPKTGVPKGNLALFTTDVVDGATSELSTSLGGYVVSIIYVEAEIQGLELDIIPGGFYGTIMEWKPNNGYEINAGNAKGFFFDELNVTQAVLYMFAFDFDLYLAEDAGLLDGVDEYAFVLDKVALTEDPAKPLDSSGSTFLVTSLLLSPLVSIITIGFLVAAGF